MLSLHRHHVDRFLAGAIPTTPGLRGLHIGCGVGPRGRYRPPAGQHWLDVDLVHGNVWGDIHNLPFRRQSFDIVRATEMIYHSSAIRQAVGECGRVLRPGGRLVITAPLLFPPINPDDLIRLTAEGWRRILPFPQVEIVPLGGYFTHLVTTLEHLSRAFCLLRPLARWDDDRYPTAYGIVARDDE